MKTAISLCLALLALSSARAQIFRPEAVNGAVLGGVAGAVIGHNSGDLRHNAWKGAAIGAGAGLILGEAVGNARDRDYRGGGEYIYRDAPRVSVGIGYSRGGYHGGYYGGGYRHAHYGYRGYWDRGYGYGFYSAPVYASYSYAPAYAYYPGYGDAYPYYDTGYYRSSAASSGLVLGALAGGIIGHNSGDFRHNGWRGAAWGAGVGWLLGSIADANRRPVVYQQAPVVTTQPVQAAQAQGPATPQQPVTIINNYYNTPSPMSSANGMFGR